MPDQELLKQVNEYLLREFGRSLGDLPNYRVIWSTGVTEKRYGTFNDFYGKILIRTVREIREVLKYPHDQERWIFEHLERAEANPELTTPVSYEPVMIFKNKRGDFLPLNMKVIEFLTNSLKNRPSSSERKAQLEEEMAEIEENEVLEFLDILHDIGRSPLFAYEDSVFLDSTKRKE